MTSAAEELAPGSCLFLTLAPQILDCGGSAGPVLFDAQPANGACLYQNLAVCADNASIGYLTTGTDSQFQNVTGSVQILEAYDKAPVTATTTTILNLDDQGPGHALVINSASVESTADQAPLVSRDVFDNCAVCNQRFDEKQRFLEHQDSWGKKLHYRCDICEEIFPDFENWKSHTKGCSNRKKFMCPQCSEGFNHEVNLRLHSLTHSTGEMRCPDCDKEFVRFASFKCHLLMHNVDDSIACDFCGEEFIYYSALAHHVKTVHEHNEENPFLSCRQCGAIFKRPLELAEHRITHKKIRDSLRTAGRRHRSATGKGNKNHRHVCGTCHKGFSRQSLLERHLRVHTGEKPFVCKTCNKAFNQQGSLAFHEAMHLPEKPFKCPLCAAGFVQKGNLRVHVKRVHPLNAIGKPALNCPFCSCVLKTYQSLTSHISRRHSDVYELDKGNADYGVLPYRPLSKVDNLASLQIRRGLDLEVTTEKSKEATEVAAEQQHAVASDAVTGEAARWVATPAQVASKERQEPRHRDGADYNGVFSVATGDNFCGSNIKGVTVKRVGDKRCWICPYCSKPFLKSSDLVRHVRVHTGVKPYGCTLCSQSFALQSTLRHHVRSHMGIKSKRCYICFKSLSTYSTFRAHMRIHNNESFDCAHCKRQFRTRAHLRSHQNQKPNCGAGVRRDSLPNPGIYPASNDTAATEQRPPPTPSQQPLVETPCGVLQTVIRGSLEDVQSQPAFDSNGQLIRPFVCHLCPMRFKRHSHLCDHIRSHTGERPYKCRLCGEAFVTCSTLKDHTRTHFGVRNFHCTFCSKSFGSRRCLKRHLFVHSDDRPFICPYCYKRFKRGVLCRKHIRTHKKVKPNPTKFPAVAAEASVPCTTTSATSCPPSSSFVTDSNFITASQFTVASASAKVMAGGVPSVNSWSMCNVAPAATSSDASFQSNFNQQNNFDAAVVHHATAISIDDLGNQGHTQNLTYGLDALASYPTMTNGSLKPSAIFQADTAGESGSPPPHMISLPSAVIAPVHVSSSEDLFPTQVSVSCATHDMLTIDTQFGSGQREDYMRHVCPSTFTPVCDFEEHSKTHTSDVYLSKETAGVFHSQVFECVYCSQNFTSAHDLAEHLQNVHKQPLLCFLCNKQFSFAVELIDHMNQEHPEDSGKSAVAHSVAMCNALEGTSHCPTDDSVWFEPNGADSDEQILIHGSTVSADDQPSWNVEDSSTVSYLHQESVQSVPKMPSVPQLAKQQPQQPTDIQLPSSEAEAESAVVSDRTVASKRVCPHCHRLFKKHCDLVRHIRVHTGEKPYKCDICERSFRIKSTLDYHRRTHKNNAYLFVCHVCYRTFASARFLNAHFRTHTNERMLNCSRCNEPISADEEQEQHLQQRHDVQETIARRPSIGSLGQDSAFTPIHQRLKPSLPAAAAVPTTPFDTELNESDKIVLKIVQSANGEFQLIIKHETETEVDAYDSSSLVFDVGILRHLAQSKIVLNIPISVPNGGSGGEQIANGEELAGISVDPAFILQQVQLQQKELYGLATGVDGSAVYDCAAATTLDSANLKNANHSSFAEAARCADPDLVGQATDLLPEPGCQPPTRSSSKTAAANSRVFFVECKICNLEFDNADESEEHFRSPEHNLAFQTRQSDELRHKEACPRCGKLFPSHQRLQRHMRTHDSQKQHLCDECGHAFLQRYALRKHKMLKHQKVKEFVCPHCLKSFGIRYNLNKHIERMHKNFASTDEMPAVSNAGWLAASSQSKEPSYLLSL